MVQKLEKQFEGETLEQILRITRKTKKLNFHGSACDYYSKSLIDNLEMGCLLGSLLISTSLLEVFIRSLVVKYCKEATAKYIDLEKILEEDRSMSFSDLIYTLNGFGLFEEPEKTIEIYNKVRIPLQHGLVERFVESHNINQEDNFNWREVFQIDYTSLHSLESVIEEESLNYIENIIDIILNNIK
jgi:hypothetical protein